VLANEPYVGQKLVLTNKGLHQLYGTNVGLGHMLTKVFRVTRVICQPVEKPPVWEIDVDDPDLNILWLNTMQFREYSGGIQWLKP